MSTVKATHFEHPSASTAGITLAADGSVVLPQGFTGGIGSNVVQVEVTSTFDTSSNSFVEYTGATLSFTPTTATSKVLLIATSTATNSAENRGAEMAIFEGSTQVSQVSLAMAEHDVPLESGGSLANQFLHSPASTSVQTYNIRVRRFRSFGTARFLYANLIAIEVAA